MIDYEIRIGRKKGEISRYLFQKNRMKMDGPEDWKDVKFMIFDCINEKEEENELLFEERIEIANKVRINCFVLFYIYCIFVSFEFEYEYQYEFDD